MWAAERVECWGLLLTVFLFVLFFVCAVIEDSYIGLSAAKAAGMTCLVTKSSYTQDEDFAAADRVVSSLDDPRVTLADLTTMAASNN